MVLPLPGEIIEHLNTAIKLQPTMALAHYFMGKELLKTSRIPEAKEAFQKAAQFGDGELKKKSEMMLYTFPKAATPKP